MRNGGIRQIALYGKGGIGKSTIACNIAVALSDMGRKVMQVGASPKGDSTSFLRGGEILEPTILDRSREIRLTEITIQDCIKEGSGGVMCMESGGPSPAEGCAGRGVALALDNITKNRIFSKYNIDFAIYDVIGDVVCGGFAQPMRAGYAREVYIVTSGELMSLYAANNICTAIKVVSETIKGGIGVGGLINNMRGVEGEMELMEEFSQRVGVPVRGNIPRSPLVQEAESRGGTVVSVFPDSPLADTYRELARHVLENQESVIPNPMELEEIMAILRKYQSATA
jgi:nitrogenase iron protein NifH